MNRDEKRSLYSFLGLYLVASLLLLGISAFWYYNAQKQMLENLLFYKMQSTAEKINSAVIEAHMSNKALNMPVIDSSMMLGLFSGDGAQVYGNLKGVVIDFKRRYHLHEGRATLVSTGTNQHLGIRFTVLHSTVLVEQKASLKEQIWGALLACALFIAVIGFFLSKIFMQPVKRRLESMDRFIKDTAHELNTPVTALMMSSKRALQKGVYDEKLMHNISISTKQLYDIYTSLTYLSFEVKEADQNLDLSELVKESMAYFDEQARRKQIGFEVDIRPVHFVMGREKGLKLFNNLISNAIKYSHPGSTVYIGLDEEKFSIKDEGIGINDAEIERLFERYRRGTDYAGGFGIGLNIVGAICVEYQIEIAIYSEPGAGTEVVLKLNRPT